MRLNIVVSNQFKKDLKLASKRGFNIDKLKEVVDKLAEQSALDKKYNDIMKSKRNAEYLNMLDKSMSEAESGKFVLKSMDELGEYE